MRQQTKSLTFSLEVRDRAVRMVLDHRIAHPSQWAALAAIAVRIGRDGAGAGFT